VHFNQLSGLKVLIHSKKMISFNAYLKNNDGLLANHIAQAETSYAVSYSV
jgi:hypothetical protein